MTPNPPPPEAQEKRTSAGTIIGGLLVAAAIAVGLWYFLLRKPEAPPIPPPVAEAPDAAVPPPAPQLSVAERDARAREALEPLSNEPEWKRWLQEQDLIGKFTAAVTNIADGESPRTVLTFLAPGGRFAVKEDRRAKRTYIAESSFARYDTVARVVGSIDVNGAARAYQTLHPIIDSVYAEIAPPGAKFDDTFAKAIDRLVNVPLPSGPIEVVPRGALYAFADQKLEQLSAAEKHLLRMGPKNQAIIQSRLRGLKAVLGLGGSPQPQQ